VLRGTNGLNKVFLGVKIVSSVSVIGILSFWVELIRFNPKSGELLTDEGDNILL